VRGGTLEDEPADRSVSGVAVAAAQVDPMSPPGDDSPAQGGLVRIARVADRPQPVPALRSEIASSAASPVDLGDRAQAVEAHGAPIADTHLVHLVVNARR